MGDLPMGKVAGQTGSPGVDLGIDDPHLFLSAFLFGPALFGSER
jgi:hypothetical protein